MSQIVTEMGRGGTMTVMTVEEIATGIAMMTETAETTIEEVRSSACLGPLLDVEGAWDSNHPAVAAVVGLTPHLKILNMWYFFKNILILIKSLVCMTPL